MAIFYPKIQTAGTPVLPVECLWWLFYHFGSLGQWGGGGSLNLFCCAELMVILSLEEPLHLLRD